MTNPESHTQAKDRPLRRWVKENHFILGLSTAGLTAIATFIGALSGWFDDVNITIDGPPAENGSSQDEPVSPMVDLDARAERLHRIAATRFSEFPTFLFAVYERKEGTGILPRSTVHIYSGTAETYALVDSQACSYPDGSVIQTDTEQGLLIVSCSFHKSYQYAPEGEDKPDYAYAVSVVRFF